MLRGAFQTVGRSTDWTVNTSNFFSWLQSVAPVFPIHGDQVEVLHKPDEFYNTLISGCRDAEKRVMLVSLYLGTGHLEQRLVQVLQESFETKGLNVNIVLDANRGSRGQPNSRTLLLPLLGKNKCAGKCLVSLFHTPDLRGPLKAVLPSKYNELVGVQHMKLFVFDDSVLISGANLSESYFTNRQDRYILIKNCPDLANFYWGLGERLASVSLKLDSSDNLIPQSHHPFKTDRRLYVQEARTQLWDYYQDQRDKQVSTDVTADTWVFPLLELPPFGVHQDSIVTRKMLETAEAECKITLSTGYFNLTKEYVESILKKSVAHIDVLMAHPCANGFLNAGGLMSGIPSVYTGLALEFQNQIDKNKASDRVKMWEYARPDWTYHSKGLWLTLPGDDLPSITFVGSSNFGFRSVQRDLESQMAVVTTSKELKYQLNEEKESLRKLTSRFTADVALQLDRKPPFWTRATMRLFKSFF